MASVNRVGQRGLEMAKVGTESVAVQEQDVVWVDRPNGLFNPHVKVDQTSMFLVGGFVQGVVTGDPSVVLVVRSEVFPDLDGSVLEVLVDPEVGLVVSSVGVPVNVLALHDGQDKQSGKSGSNSLLGRRASR